MSIATPSNVVSAVRAYARAHAILRPGPIVLAVSGGTDSTALCLILADLRDEFGLVLHVAHLDHRARPRAAAADAAFVGELANHIDAQVRVGRADAAPKSEDDARKARYEFLRRVSRDLGATAIATGHTRDDQAETVLLHLTRGAGLPGLAGMRPERDGIVRPLLTLGRADTVAVCAAAGITPREDPTNRSMRFARNRIRHRVLPELAKLNPEIISAIARLSETAAALADISADHAAVILDGATSPDGATKRQSASGGQSATSPDPATEPGALARDRATLALERLPSRGHARADALALWWERGTGERLTARHRAALERLAASTDGSRSLNLPGGRAFREYATLRIDAHATKSAATDKKSLRNGPMTLERGRTMDWQGWRFALDVEFDGAAHVAYIDGERLIVRGRRSGDRMRGPKGAKVQDVFTNAKVPARDRDDWPLVTADGAVLWIPGITQPPRSGRTALQARRLGEDSPRMTLGNPEQVASLREVRPAGEERGRART